MKYSLPMEIYFNELRDDQMIYLNPTSTMTVERAMEITGGQRIVFAADSIQLDNVRFLAG
jgi:hypothetical protein